MGNDVAGVSNARSLEIFGAGASSFPHFWQRRIIGPAADKSDNFPVPDRIRPALYADVAAAERRAAALEVSVDRMLIGASARASEQLKSIWPQLSAATLNLLVRMVPLFLGVLAVAATFSTPGTIVFSIIVALPAAFRIWIVLCPVATSPLRPSFPPDQEEPMYSVIAPLRGEARVVDQLLSAIERLNYPAEKLDVIIAVEANDDDTRAAITARKHRIPITVIPVPPSEPGTKPKALNVALPFARGMFTVIYDAEDRPERNQLRAASAAFRSAGNEFACVQARLYIDTRTSWLARYFTAEYAGQFDVFLPKLAALGLPLPLGGSSNHFRTEVLREVGGWDPYNVTEDADLGMRLARFGYRSGVIDSTTYEEAPADIRRWLGQRIRWFKGWMQTWLVHMREPRRLFRELGGVGVLTFQLIVGGNALVALVHPVFILGLIWEVFALASQDYGLAAFVRLAHYLAAAAAGYLTSAYLGWRGLSHRIVPNKTRVLLCTPMHWLLLSLAAWRAAFELIWAPFRWRKTEHGLDEASRQESATRSLLELERYLTGLIRRGELAQIRD
jgi:cellulose synthase/poly-beta-1,6-N-acetylglucosamine synthase-like glycosyltransferase